MKPIALTSLDEAGRRLAARAADMARRNAYDIIASDFLTPREQRIFACAAAAEGEADRLFFAGGALGAERRCAVFVPDWMRGDVPAGDPFCEEREAFLFEQAKTGTLDLAAVVTPLTMSVSAYHTLTHRDWLGALLALGIERHVLGDLAVLDGQTAIGFFCTRIAPFIEKSFTRAGADAVRVARRETDWDFVIPRAYERMEITVASPRLDGVVHALTGISRAEAAAAVARGEAEVNYFVETRPDVQLEEGDILSVRGWGKCRVDSTHAVTRRGRNRVLVRKYI